MVARASRVRWSRRLAPVEGVPSMVDPRMVPRRSGDTMPKQSSERDVQLHALEDHEAVERAGEAMWKAEGGGW